MDAQQVPQAGVWRHYKGQRYLVLGIGQHTETGEECVVYVPLYDDPTHDGPALRCRPLAMWFEAVEYQGQMAERFRYEGPRR